MSFLYCLALNHTIWQALSLFYNIFLQVSKIRAYHIIIQMQLTANSKKAKKYIRVQEGIAMNKILTLLSSNSQLAFYLFTNLFSTANCENVKFVFFLHEKKVKYVFIALVPWVLLVAAVNSLASVVASLYFWYRFLIVYFEGILTKANMLRYMFNDFHNIAWNLNKVSPISKALRSCDLQVLHDKLELAMTTTARYCIQLRQGLILVTETK